MATKLWSILRPVTRLRPEHVRHLCLANTSLVSQTGVLSSSHDFNSVEFPVPKEKLDNILGQNRQNLDRIQAISGAVVRLKQEQSADADTKTFRISGSAHQIKHTLSLLKSAVEGKPMARGHVGKAVKTENEPIWKGYRRNFKGQYAPSRTRKTCIRWKSNGREVSGNPCPICKIIVEKEFEQNYLDTKFLEQFICQHTWNVLPATTTGLCRKQQKILEDNIQKARDYGLLPFTLPLPSDEVKPHKPAGVPTDRKISVKMH